MKILILGASSGFGREFVKKLCNDNEIIAISNEKQGLLNLKKEIKDKYNRDIKTDCKDLRIEKDINYLCETYKDIDFLINSAGTGKIGNIAEVSYKDEKSIIDLNVIGFYTITKRFSLEMMKRRQGFIINVCSTASFIPMPNFAIYAATKAFAASYTIALMKELKNHNVKIMALCPGTTNTNFLDEEYFEHIRKKMGKNAIYMYPDRIVKKALIKFKCGKRIYIPRFRDKIIYYGDKLLPISFTTNIIYNLFEHIKRREQ